VLQDNNHGGPFARTESPAGDVLLMFFCAWCQCDVVYLYKANAFAPELCEMCFKAVYGRPAGMLEKVGA
jgi:hypothetical protein